MTIAKKVLIILTLQIIAIASIKSKRSIYRPEDPLMPEIITKWSDDCQEYHLKNSHLEEHALFTKFDHDYFMEHLLPKEFIYYRNNQDKSVLGSELDKLIEHLLTELNEHKTKFKHFKVLKNQDFNHKTISGLLIVKFKKYPFVLKLFIETPETFVKPFSKGWQPCCFFLMGGGINRYLSGFTRIKNLEAIKNQISNHPEWSDKLDVPRKWFWIPAQNRWFELHSKNIGKEDRCLKLPSIYGIIADAINTRKNFSLLNKENRKLALELSFFLGSRIDPHIDNFMLEIETGKLIIVDTEHFPTMVGLKKPIYFRNYTSWYTQLSWKFFKDKFCRYKKLRRENQYNSVPELSI